MKVPFANDGYNIQRLPNTTLPKYYLTYYLLPITLHITLHITYNVQRLLNKKKPYLRKASFRRLAIRLGSVMAL